MDQFQWAAGSIIGTEHQRLGKNNQDAYLVRVVDNGIVGVVADGCGSCPHSEVGAWFGVEFVTQAIAQRMTVTSEPLDETFFNDLRHSLIAALPTQLDPTKYYLFTLLGFAINATETVIFGCGDGVMAINGEVRTWAFANNAPPYLIYPDETIRIITKIPTETVRSLLVSTDGLEYWLKQQEIAEFWQNEKYFKNPDQVRRRLAIANKQATLLKDDTTLIVVNRQG